MHIYPWESDPTPKSIKHRCLEYHYTTLGTSTGRPTPLMSRDAVNTATPNLADILPNLPPQSIKHRCLAYHYTKLSRSNGRSAPSQSSIDALHTTTPNWADLMTDLPPQSIKHRCIAYHYTKLDLPTGFWSSSFSIVVTLQLTICMQLKCSFPIIIICNCHHFATDCLHAVKMLIYYYCHFQLSSLCNWPSSGVCPLYNIWDLGVKGTSAVLWNSAHFCSISQNMHYKAPLDAQPCKTNKVVWTWKDDLPPPRELLLTKDLLPERVTI